MSRALQAVLSALDHVMQERGGGLLLTEIREGDMAWVVYGKDDNRPWRPLFTAEDQEEADAMIRTYIQEAQRDNRADAAYEARWEEPGSGH